MEPNEVEFEHRRLKPGTVPASLQHTRASLAPLPAKVLRRARGWRLVFVVLGAAAIAFGTQRAGIELPYALCFFFGALPVLWVGGWVFGFFFTAQRSVKKVASTMGSTQWQQELAAATELEKVKLSMSTLGLHLTRDGQSSVVGWNRVRMARMGPETLAVYVGEDTGLAMNEGLMVPRSAFASDTAFDDFCLQLQRHLWEAERKA